MALPSYDKDQKTVFGEGYSIRWAGRDGREELIDEIFFYQDQNVEFYFTADRSVWIVSPEEKATTSRIADTEIYSVSRLWCHDIGCVYRKENISQDFKHIARKKIAEGMVLMEGYSEKPPKKVKFRPWAG